MASPYSRVLMSCENYLFSFAIYDGKLSCVLLSYCLISPVIAKDSLIALRNNRELYCRFSDENDYEYEIPSIFQYEGLQKC